MGARDKYRQRADEHPRPHVDVPMSLFGVRPFAGNYQLVGEFVHAWCHAVWKKDPGFLGSSVADETTMACLLSAGFLVKDGHGLRLTGPNRDRNWLIGLPKSWMTYAIEAVGQNAVKIGRSTSVSRRLEELQGSSSCQVRLLGSVRRDVEEMLHRELSDHRIIGEWFRLSGEVLAALKRVGLLP